MRRREFLAGAAAAVAAAHLRGQGREGPALNVVFLLFDKCRTDAIGCYGGPQAYTPNIDELAGGGVRFNNCYTPQALCGPARASILTGVYPHAHGLRKNVYPEDPPAGNNNVYEDPIPDAFADRRFRLWNNFPYLLHNAGYETAQIGKWHLGARNPGFFDTWKGFNSVLPHWVGKPHDSVYRPDVQTEQGIDFIERNAGRPFFLYQSYYPPHEPQDPPEQFLARHKGKPNAGYYASVENLDWNVGRITAALRKQRILDRTLIIVTTEHGRTWDDRPGTTHGMSIGYEDAARVPLVMRCPGVLPRGKVWNAGVCLTDLMPTILDAVNVSAFSPVLADVAGKGEPERHGRSLLPLVNSGNDVWDRPVVVQNLSQKPLHGRHFEERTIRRERWKLITRSFAGDASLRADELYDLDADPGERTNLIGSAAARPAVAAMAKELAGWAKATGDTLGATMAARLLRS